MSVVVREYNSNTEFSAGSTWRLWTCWLLPQACDTPSLPNHSEQGDINMPFEKGQSGNPGGRPKVIAEVKELARAHTGVAIQTLVSIMTNPKSAPAARVLSCERVTRQRLW